MIYFSIYKFSSKGVYTNRPGNRSTNRFYQLDIEYIHLNWYTFKVKKNVQKYSKR